MPTLTLYCKRPTCGRPYTPNGEILDICPECHEPTDWTTFAPKYNSLTTLSVDDQAFLRQIHIRPED